jgi:hypothetical protein
MAHIRVEQVNNHPPIIQEYPARIAASLATKRKLGIFQLGLFADVIADGVQLAFVRGIADHEVIGDSGDLAQIGQQDVFALLIADPFDNIAGQINGFQNPTLRENVIAL